MSQVFHRDKFKTLPKSGYTPPYIVLRVSTQHPNVFRIKINALLQANVQSETIEHILTALSNALRPRESPQKYGEAKLSSIDHSLNCSRSVKIHRYFCNSFAPQGSSKVD